MADDQFHTIAQHWAHFLERDIAPNSPAVQVMEMKRAFAAGAISGLQLAISTMKSTNPRADIQAHIEGIKTLGKPHG